MTLGELLTAQPGKRVQLRQALSDEVAALEVWGLEYDSRRVEKGFVFFAFAGARLDGRRFAADAVARGAIAVVSDQPMPEGFASITRPQGEGPVWIQVEDGRRALAVAARRFYEFPDRKVAFTGITGTNGKTTTAYLIESVFGHAGFTTGLIGTIEYRLAGEVLPAVNTTPESLDLARFAASLIARGGTHLISEVSSHALAAGRVYGFEFHTAVFTNLTRDHLDFHGTMEKYEAAKQLLFAPEEGPAPKFAVLNANDAAAERMRPPASTNVIWYGKTGLRAENVRSTFEGLRFDLVWEGERQPVESPLVGAMNVSNILAAAGAGLSYGLSLATIAQGIAKCAAVPGRFERINMGQPFLVAVDYAHTDDALRNTIQTARGLTKGRVITLFGCGGDRDRSKRPLMGMAAGELSDYVVLTSDNPRSEDPILIMNDALVGLNRFDTPHVAEPDRAKAIRLAIAQAAPGDVVLIAGKGHEPYQILKDTTIHFDDRETAREVLTSFGYRGTRNE